VGTAKQIDGQFTEMTEMMNRYDEVKRACQVNREEYVRHAERGAEELRIGVENQIDILSEFLDLSRFKKVKHEN
jgi:energy-converting hydrogenase A subunit M